MKALAVLALGMLLAPPALAQPPEKPNEVHLAVGDAGLIFAFEDAIVTVFTLGHISYRDEKLGFQVVGGYQRHLNDWASVGFTGSWAGSRRTAYIGSTPLGEVERRALTFVVDGRAHWLRRPSVRLYSGLALGVAEIREDQEGLGDEDALSTVGFHVIPVGVRYGRDIGAFAETGLGWHGFIKAGLTRRW